MANELPDADSRVVRVTVESTRTPASQWVMKWLKEESFWREMVTRTSSGILVLLVVFYYGIASGYVERPDIQPVFRNIILPILIAGVFTWLQWRYRTPLSRILSGHTSLKESSARKLLAVVRATTVLAGFIAVVVLTIASIPSSPTIDCVSERANAIQLYRLAPNAFVPFEEGSTIEQQCQINEIIRRLQADG